MVKEGIGKLNIKIREQIYYRDKRTRQIRALRKEKPIDSKRITQLERNRTFTNREIAKLKARKRRLEAKE